MANAIGGLAGAACKYFRDDILIELLSDLLSCLIHVGTEISASGCAVLLPYSLAFF